LPNAPLIANVKFKTDCPTAQSFNLSLERYQSVAPPAGEDEVSTSFSESARKILA
jgi:hypothetical protein